MTGKEFEDKFDLKNILESNGYWVSNNEVFDKDNNKIGEYYKKGSFGKIFLKKKHNTTFEDYLSYEKQPDDCFVNLKTRTVYVIEKKYQQMYGTTDEKLDSAPVLKKRYEMVVNPLGYKVELGYILCDWFRKEKRYIITKAEFYENNISYWIENFPLSWLNIGID